MSFSIHSYKPSHKQMCKNHRQGESYEFGKFCTQTTMQSNLHTTMRLYIVCWVLSALTCMDLTLSLQMENVRFVQLALHQGKTKKSKAAVTLVNTESIWISLFARCLCMSRPQDFHAAIFFLAVLFTVDRLIERGTTQSLDEMSVTIYLPNPVLVAESLHVL